MTRREFGGTDDDALLDLLRAVSRRRTTSRSELRAISGLGRSTIHDRVDKLVAVGLLSQSVGASSGGRPASALQLNPDAGVIVGIDIGTSASSIGLFDLRGDLLATKRLPLKASAGPELVLDTLILAASELLQPLGPPSVLSVGAGIAAPVDFQTGAPKRPFLMPGWDGFDVPGYLGKAWRAPVVVDNEANVMAIGEHRAELSELDTLLFVKVGSGISAGLILNGEIFRGARGAAGDIGHIRVVEHSDVVCECGNVGCLEALAGGRALLERLRSEGQEVPDLPDLVHQVNNQVGTAIAATREAGRLIGGVLAATVNTLNPDVVVVGGELAHDNEQLLTGIRESLYAQASPLASAELRLIPSRLGATAGITGAAHIAVDAAFRRLIDAGDPRAELAAQSRREPVLG